MEAISRQPSGTLVVSEDAWPYLRLKLFLRLRMLGLLAGWEDLPACAVGLHP
jgi:hypothetical protein